MNKKFTAAAILVLVVGSIFLYYMAKNYAPEDIAGNSFTNHYHPKTEEMCCEDCLNHGIYENSKDCLEIIRENNGIRHCYLILKEFPHSYAQCSMVAAR